MYLNFEILVFFFTGAKPVWYNFFFLLFTFSFNIINRPIKLLALSISWCHSGWQYKPVQSRQGHLLIRGFLLFFHHPKLHLNILYIFSHTWLTSRLKPDNEKSPAIKYFYKFLKKHKYFLQKRCCFWVFLFISANYL